MKINYIPWREQLDINEVTALSDEYGFDDFLDAAEEGSSSVASRARRVLTPTPNFQLHGDVSRKMAAITNWDTEFRDAQAHARDILSQIG